MRIPAALHPCQHAILSALKILLAILVRCISLFCSFVGNFPAIKSARHLSKFLAIHIAYSVKCLVQIFVHFKLDCLFIFTYFIHFLYFDINLLCVMGKILGWLEKFIQFFYKRVCMEKSKWTFLANPVFSILGNVATHCFAIGNSIDNDGNFYDAYQ